jgi:hypothetical protein
MAKGISCFSDWWALYGQKYEKIGVNEIVARSIWNDACDTMKRELLKMAKDTI